MGPKKANNRPFAHVSNPQIHSGGLLDSII